MLHLEPKSTCDRWCHSDIYTQCRVKTSFFRHVKGRFWFNYTVVMLVLILLCYPHKWETRHVQITWRDKLEKETHLKMKLVCFEGYSEQSYYSGKCLPSQQCCSSITLNLCVHLIIWSNHTETVSWIERSYT